MQEVIYGDLTRLSADLQEAAKGIPSLIREAHEAIAEDILSAVQGKIGGTGKVQRWQDSFVGSGGGYAAVRAKAKTYDAYNRAVGYITNAIEGGHRIRPPGKSKRYKPRIQKGKVPGKEMYAQTRSEAERIAYAAGERVMDTIADRLEE